jgi:hypothetical protein
MEVIPNIIRKEKILISSEQKFVNGLKNSLNQVELHQKGGILLKDAYGFLIELQSEASTIQKRIVDKRYFRQRT